jgi:hypothetical protein
MWAELRNLRGFLRFTVGHSASAITSNGGSSYTSTVSPSDA